VARAPQTGTGQPAVNPLAQAASQPTAQPAVPSSGPNANPLDLFPQVIFMNYAYMRIFSSSIFFC
jgi:UV excision repair protein RAD23